MLEYDIDEAQALLEKNLSTATKNLESLEEDLDFLRDQFTTTEVSILFEVEMLGCSLHLLSSYFKKALGVKELQFQKLYFYCVFQPKWTLGARYCPIHLTEVDA